MPPERSDLAPLTDAFTNFIVTIVRYGLERIEPDELTSRFADRVLLTRQETAECLAIGLSELNKLKTAGKLKPVRVAGGSKRLVRYRRVDVESFGRKLKPVE